MSKDTNIKIALWQRNIGGDKSKPIFKGKVEFPDGRKLDVSLWVNSNSSQNAPAYTGVIESD